jgi:ferredoxin--NADP+ reductase
MRLQDYDTTSRFTGRVVSTERITPAASAEEVREIVLEIDRPDLELEAGQSVGLLAPGQEAFGQKHHFRLYSVADLPERSADGKARVRICVRRCNYVDEHSGEEYKGVASNYLCDLRAGDTLTLTGPYGLAFEVPPEPDANLILIGTGTGIAPFRALVKHLYRGGAAFKGRVWLFYGARSGLELLYMNEKKDDFAQYYDEGTFEAIQALSRRPAWSEEIDWSGAMESRAEELWRMLGEARTYVYVAGLENVRDQLDAVFARIAGSKEQWTRRKAELQAGDRWVELLY